MPVLKSILEALSNDELSMEEYPSVTPMPIASASQAGRSNNARSSRKASGAATSVRKSAGASSKWATNSSSGGGKRSGGPANFNGARNMVFMIGGLCYPEMRVAREVMESESREIIMGSTAFLSANDFIDDLGKLADQKR